MSSRIRKIVLPLAFIGSAALGVLGISALISPENETLHELNPPQLLNCTFHMQEYARSVWCSGPTSNDGFFVVGFTVNADGGFSSLSGPRDIEENLRLTSALMVR